MPGAGKCKNGGLTARKIKQNLHILRGVENRRIPGMRKAGMGWHERSRSVFTSRIASHPVFGLLFVEISPAHLYGFDARIFRIETTLSLVLLTSQSILL